MNEQKYSKQEKKLNIQKIHEKQAKGAKNRLFKVRNSKKSITTCHLYGSTKSGIDINRSENQ